MYLLNQPFQGQMGDILKDQMLRPYTGLTIFSAFAKTSGVLRLKRELADFKAANGATITAFIGIDAHGTSVEALQNLMDICDELYVVHSDNDSTTYHPKVYLFEDEYTAWMAVGSNNLTGGGLWTNFESSTICECSKAAGSESFAALYRPAADLIAVYRDPACAFSMRLTGQEEIDALTEAGYLWAEHRMSIDRRRQKASAATGGRGRYFSAKKVASLPAVPPPTGAAAPPASAAPEEPSLPLTDRSGACLWMETGELTGGSANQPEPSASGTLIEGSAAGTIFESPRPGRLKGSIVYFGLSPDAVDAAKHITLNYRGADYEGCSVEHKPGNSNWRIVLKGKNKDGHEIQKCGAPGWLKHKVLIFRRIADDYYALTICEESVLEELKAGSIFWGSNGSSTNFKKFGLI